MVDGVGRLVLALIRPVALESPGATVVSWYLDRNAPHLLGRPGEAQGGEAIEKRASTFGIGSFAID